MVASMRSEPFPVAIAPTRSPGNGDSPPVDDAINGEQMAGAAGTRILASLVTAILIALAPAAIHAQPFPFSGEFRVNSYVTSGQAYPDVASIGDGNFVVVWSSALQDGSARGLFGQRFDGSGAKAGPEFRVNTYTTNSQKDPAVAADGAGGFIAVWDSDGQDGDGLGVFGQRFDASGSKVGAEFRVNSYTTSNQGAPSIATDGAGNFVVVWRSSGQGESTLNENVFGQRFNSGGSKVGPEFRVNTYTTSRQTNPSIAADRTGGFVVVWTGYLQDGSNASIFGQRFDVSGAKVGPEFPVNTYTPFSQYFPAVASASGGTFVVAWESGQDGGGYGIFGQRFDATGAKIGGEFQVNTYTTSHQTRAAVTLDGAGNFVVVWQSLDQDGSNYGVFGQAFDRRGERVGPEFSINVHTSGSQSTPRIIHNGVVHVVVWANAETSGADVVGRRQNFTAAALTVDARSGQDTVSDSNGMLEPGERVLIEPAWTNRNTFFASLNGTLASLTGPPGGIYLINDASAAYPETAPDTAVDCDDGDPEDCYVVSVAGARPATHWDATAQEAVGFGGAKVWKLHVGSSFSDVPKTHPFYRRIETILHAGITSGCTETQYCPSAPVSRDQLAIFLAKGIAALGENVPATGTLLGAPYNCSTGGASLFADVSPADPFCKHVHYLALQNVTLGCNVAAYCPTQLVSRGEMASLLSKAMFAPGGGSAVPSSYTDPITNLAYSCEPASPTLHFTDVPATHPFCKHIHFLWAKGIVAGCSTTQYCPAQTVNRAAMAKFVANGFGLTLYGP
jgi:hypothetical protein